MRGTRLVFAARLILVALAAAAAVSAFVYGRHDPRLGAAAGRRYVCPMHPQVTSSAPADCSICGMMLSEAGAAPAPAAKREAPAARREGNVESARRRIFTQEVRAAAWVAREDAVRALLHADEIETLDPGEQGVFIAAASPATRARVQLAGARIVRADASTSWVDFHLASGQPPLRPGATGWLELPARPRAVLVVPSTAVLQSAAGPYVLASDDGRGFARRPVTVGSTFFGLATIVSGLREEERVAVRNAFFLDAEARLGQSAGTLPVKR